MEPISDDDKLVDHIDATLRADHGVYLRKWVHVGLHVENERTRSIYRVQSFSPVKVAMLCVSKGAFHDGRFKEQLTVLSGNFHVDFVWADSKSELSLDDRMTLEAVFPIDGDPLEIKVPERFGGNWNWRGRFVDDGWFIQKRVQSKKARTTGKSLGIFWGPRAVTYIRDGRAGKLWITTPK
jgi:hypothetical protein